MAVRDYYSLLNFSRQEPPAGIAAAHRDFDRNVEHVLGAFWPPTKIIAFERVFSVLSQESTRRTYDQALEAQGRSYNTTADVFEVESIFARPESVHPSFEGLYRRLARNFTGVGIPKSEHPESLTLEIPVSAEDIRRQRVVSIGVPTFDVCPRCNGAGRVALFECAGCDGSGVVERTGVVQHVLGAERIVERSLEDVGIRNCYLRIEVHVTRM